MSKASDCIHVLNLITGGLLRDGISLTNLDFIRAMDKTSLQIDVAAYLRGSEELLEEFEAAGSHVIKLPHRKKHTLAYLAALYRLLRSKRYEVVHVHGSSGMMSLELLTARLCGVPVRIAHSRNTKSDNPKLDRLLRPLFNACYTDAFACGEDAGRFLFGEKPFTVIHNGKDLTKFRYDAALGESVRSANGWTGKTVIGHVGNLNAQKNHTYLLDIFQQYVQLNPDSVLYLMGGGPLEPELRAKAAACGLEDKVVFAGRVSNVPEMLQAMDIMVFPSLFEGLPNVVLEWQAAGLPCLISDRITRECAPSSLVAFMPLEEAPEQWAGNIQQMLSAGADRAASSLEACEDLKRAGFEIRESANHLRERYQSLVELRQA